MSISAEPPPFLHMTSLESVLQTAQSSQFYQNSNKPNQKQKKKERKACFSDVMLTVGDLVIYHIQNRIISSKTEG